MKKFLALVLALVMTMSLVTVSASAKTDFTDDDKIVNTEAVEVLSAAGILGGYADGTYRPQATLTRGAGAKLVAYAVLGQEAADNLKATYTVFKDVKDGVGLAAYIEWAYAQGIVSGYGDGNFGPYDTLTEYAFGKMLLAALGYDAKVEGYTGAGWQKNVYADAYSLGIYDGTESQTACTRDTAARMLLGAMKSRIVVYGSASINGKYFWNGVEINAGSNNYAYSVDGVIELIHTLGSLYGLDYKEEAHDVFGRPGHAWAYDDADFEQFYMDEAVAEYTTAIKTCDILVDCGYAKDSKDVVAFDHWVAGIHDDAHKAVSHVKAANIEECSYSIGGQGVLTQVFQLDDAKVGNTTYENYRVTEIYTSLAKVESVTKATHIKNDASVLTVYVADQGGSVLNVSKAANKYLTVTLSDAIDYKKGDYVLVTYGFAEDSNDYVALDGEYTITKTEDGKGNGATSASNAISNYMQSGGLFVIGQPTIISSAKFDGLYTDLSQAHVAGNWEKVSYMYSKSASGLTLSAAQAKKNYNFYVDQYGNLIGDAKADSASTYGVIAKIKWENLAGFGNEKALVRVVGTDAVASDFYVTQYNSKDITGVSNDNGVPATPTVAELEADNTAYYTTDTVCYGVVKNYGNDNLVPVGLKDAQNAFIDESVETGTTANSTVVSFTKGKGNIEGMNSLVNNATIFLVKTVVDKKDVYTSYTGIDNLPTIKAAKYVTAVTEKDETFASFVYIDATNSVFTGSDVEAVVLTTGATYWLDNAEYAFTLYINGEKVEQNYVSTYLNVAADDLFKVDGTVKPGVWKLHYDSEGKLISAERKSDSNGKVVTDGVDAGFIKVDGNTTALNVANAKVYVLNLKEGYTATTADWTENWKNIDSVSVGSLSDIAKDNIVIYRFVADTTINEVGTIWVCK